MRELLDRYRLTPANLVAGAIGIGLAVALFVVFLVYVSHYSKH